MTIRIVFMGGGPTQSQHERKVTARIEELHPDVRVTWEFSDWKKSWGVVLHRASRRVADADGVVIHQKSPTLFGAALRKLCNDRNNPKVWTTCTGNGADSMLSSITTVANLVRTKQGGSA